MMSSTTTSQDVQNLAGLLQALTKPDTNTIRQAEAQLKPILKNPASMPLLWHIVADTSQDIAVRHVGAIVLRKRLPAHYSNSNEKQQWLDMVLRALAIEQVRPVRAGLIGVAAALGQVEQTANPAMLQFLQAAMNEPQARELCFLLLEEMTETVGMHWKEHLASLHELYKTVLCNQNEAPNVQKAAVQSLGQLMRYWADEDEIEGLAPLLPTLLQVASRSANDDEFLTTVLDVLYELAYSSHHSLVPYTELCVQFALECVKNHDVELRVRDSAALAIATTAEAKPKTFGRNANMLGAVLDALFQLMQDSSESAAGALFESNPAWKEDLDDMDPDADDLDSPTETSMAQGTLDVLACEIPKKFVWPAALQRCVERLRSSDPNARKAGVAGLGVIAEGCCEPMSAELANVMPLVFQAAQDPFPQVRECACFCLGQISEHCQPDILAYAEQILPIVFGLLDDNSVAVQATSCYVLEMFCEKLEPSAVRPVLNQLVNKLAQMLERTNKRSVKEMSVAALAATAVAAENEFTPYVEGVASLMKPLMTITDPNLFSLRGRALECMGHMAIAVGRDPFRSHFPETMRCAMEGLAAESTDLQEFAYAVFANLAKVMKEEFAPALPELVPHLLEVMEMDEGHFQKVEDEGDQFNLNDSDDEDDQGQMVLQVRTALLDVKKGATTAIGEMAAYCGPDFCVYLEKTMQALQQCANNWHPVIKAEAADQLPSMIMPSIAAYHNGEIQWKKGVAQDYLHPHTKAIVIAVLTEEIALLTDDDKMTVSKACQGIQTIVELCGPASISGSTSESILSAVYAILTKTAPCSVDLYGEDPDDDDDHDDSVQSACDLIGGICRVMGPHFAQYLDKFLPVICEYGKSSRPSSDRSMSIGSLSEIVEQLEGAIGSHWSNYFCPAILAGLGDEDDSVKRNAAFCAGLCAEHLHQQIGGDFPRLLSGLGPIFGLDASNESSAACIDNAAAAIARMIMASPQSVPMAQVVPALLSSLPLKNDYSENETVYKCVIGLIQSKNADLMAHGNEVRRALTEACTEDSVEDELKQKIQHALHSIP